MKTCGQLAALTSWSAALRSKKEKGKAEPSEKCVYCTYDTSFRAGCTVGCAEAQLAAPLLYRCMLRKPDWRAKLLIAARARMRAASTQCGCIRRHSHAGMIGKTPFGDFSARGPYRVAATIFACMLNSLLSTFKASFSLTSLVV